VLFSLFVFLKARRSDRLRAKIPLFIVIDVGLACVFFSFSRASWLACGLVLFLLLFVDRRTVLRFVLPGVIGAVILITLALPQERNHAERRMTTVGTIGSRMVINISLVRMFLARPLFGWGHDTYEHYRSSFVKDVGSIAATEWDKHWAASHNTFLTILAENGLIGLGLYCTPLLLLLYALGRFLREHRDEELSDLCPVQVYGIVVACFITVSMFIDAKFLPFFLGALWMCLGFICNHVRACLPNFPNMRLSIESWKQPTGSVNPESL
jgi:O-antigen ligase